MSKDLKTELAQLLRDHRRCYAVEYGTAYECICGERVSSNSHHVQSKHQAEKVIEYFDVQKRTQQETELTVIAEDQ